MEELTVPSSQSTFRDPAGTLQVTLDGALRSVADAYAPDMLAFLETSLNAKLIAEGLLISSEVLSPATATKPLLLRHPRISFISYPSEWPPSLWQAAAELTLDLCTQLLAEGWILKDATPFNVLFQGARPIFVDVLSIQRADLTSPIWFAYGQFVRTFLLPLFASSRLGWPLQDVITRRDGYEPEEIYAALSWPQRLRQPALKSITLPILLSKNRSMRTAGAATRKFDDPDITRHILTNTLADLRKATLKSMPAPHSSEWSQYGGTAPHYNEQDHATKRSFVTTILSGNHPSHVVDIGCNTGTYSKLAADAGAEVVAIDADLQALDRLCAEAKATGQNILPLCVDLAYPTPATGWENNECAGFLDRCYGHFDTVLMLAFIHHLLLVGQIPLNRIASVASKITTRNLIIEWVPPTDPKFLELLRGREALYTHLTESNFRAAFHPYFDIAQETTLHNGRILLHLIKR
jgi:SAM-dependent methyltransferase